MSDGQNHPTHRFLRLFAAAGLGVVTWLLVRWLGALADQGVPRGIVALELIGNARGAGHLIGDLDGTITAPEAHIVRQALEWDVVFIVSYTAVLMVSVRLLVPLYRLRLLRSNAKQIMAVAAVPGVLDLVEDALVALAVSPARQSTDGWYLAASAFAFAKFLTLVAALLLLCGAVSSGAMTRNEFYVRLEGEDTLQQVSPPAPPTGRGIALSGGGVRAASLSLGALQELDRDQGPLGWDQVRAVTSVSGGSYLAGAWQLGREGPQATADSWVMHASPPGKVSPEEEHLLNNLGYLTATWPRGRPGDPGAPTRIRRATKPDDMAERMRSSASFQATVLTGFLVNVAVLSAVVVLMVVPIGLLLRWLAGLDGTCAAVASTPQQATCLAGQPRMWAPGVIWLGSGLVLSVLWVLVGKIHLKPILRLLSLLKNAVGGALTIGAVLTVVLVGAPLLVAVVRGATIPAVVAGIGAAAAMLGSVVRIVRKLGASLAPKLGGIAFLLVLALGSAGVISAVWFDVRSGVDRLVLVAAAVLLVAWLVSPELWSLTAFYRGKLRSAYALWRRAGEAVAYVNDAQAEPNPGPDARYRREPLLSESPRSPLTICAAAHATTKAVRTHYHIPAMSFTFSPHDVRLFVPEDDQGHSGMYRCTIEQLANVYPGGGWGFATRRITTMFAVALSGAAVSPAMGRFRVGAASVLLAFTNVRLGAWLPNPRYVTAADAAEGAHRFPKVRLGYLLKEALAIHDPTDLFVYVSDGGHWENTGLVELLRRGMPAEVMLVDADAGRPASIMQLTQAIDLANLECGVEIFIDIEPLRGYPDREGGPIFAERSVGFGLMRQGEHWAVLWYTKPILTKKTPTSLLAHREIDAHFPETSTLNQFFDTSTYAAYRDLGRYNAAEVVAAREALLELVNGHHYVQAFVQVPDWRDRHWVQRAFFELLQQQPNETREAIYIAVREALSAPPTPDPHLLT